MSVRTDDIHHVGVVVADLQATCERLTRISHLLWSPEIRAEVPVWTRETGRIEALHFRLAYSVLAPHIKVVQSIPGTFMAAAHRPLHHVGYWSDDLSAESKWLESQGLARVACAMHGGLMYGFAFHTARDGSLCELVDRAAFPDWDGFLRGSVPFLSMIPFTNQTRALGRPTRRSVTAHKGERCGATRCRSKAPERCYSHGEQHSWTRVHKRSTRRTRSRSSRFDLIAK